jgi:hypothetical protein
MVFYRFGILRENVGYHFAAGTIEPVPGYSSVKKWIDVCAHEDGFLYPPVVESRTKNDKTVSKSQRAAHLHRVPPTHELRLTRLSGADHQRAHASFVIQLMGYLYGTWLQFDDWWFDARVPLGGMHNIHFAKKTAEHFLSHAYVRWQEWSGEVRHRFTNILFMLNRAPSYDWDWEHFLIEYMVLDACHKTAEDLKMVPNRGKHGDRIERLCKTYNLMQDANLIKDIVRLRNDLFHETLWDHGQPGTASSPNSFFSPLHLRRLNQRLVLGLLGYENDYMRSCWWSIGTFSFGIP